MPSRRLRLGIVLLVCLSLGVHRGVIQGIAWTQMLVHYASETTLLGAVEMTFDGEHPCPLCKAVQKDREAEGKQPQQSPQAASKLHAVLVNITTLTAPSADVFTFRMPRQSAVQRCQAPETPPPRCGQA
jgi:hypothetical protein